MHTGFHQFQWTLLVELSIIKWKIQKPSRKGHLSKPSNRTSRRFVRDAIERPTITLKELKSSVAEEEVKAYP